MHISRDSNQNLRIDKDQQVLIVNCATGAKYAAYNYLVYVNYYRTLYIVQQAACCSCLFVCTRLCSVIHLYPV